MNTDKNNLDQIHFMPFGDYKTITIEGKLYEKFKRDVGRLVTPVRKISMSDYATEILISAIGREEFMQKHYPHLRFVGNIESGCMIEDTKKHRPVTVKVIGKNIISDPMEVEYLIFACLHPSFRLQS